MPADTPQAATASGHGASNSSEGQPRGPYRSWRKKYRKMKLKFDNMMRDSNTLYGEEQKAIELARRLQRQNSQLLELLLDINDSDEMPADMRYQLGDAADDHTENATNHMQPSDKDRGSKRPRSLSDLVKNVRHTPLLPDPDSFMEPAGDPHPLEYFSPSEQNQYLLELDASLGDPSAIEALQSEAARPNMKNMTPEEEAEDTTLHNPMSVYNWLKKHQPHIFTQETENTAEKSSKKKKKDASGVTASGTAATGTPVPDPDHNGDEDDHLVGGDTFGWSAKGKRTRQDDTAYRPKGGSSKPAKRKRKDGDEGGSVKKAKKAAPVSDDDSVSEGYTSSEGSSTVENAREAFEMLEHRWAQWEKGRWVNGQWVEGGWVPRLYVVDYLRTQGFDVYYQGMEGFRLLREMRR